MIDIYPDTSSFPVSFILISVLYNHVICIQVGPSQMGARRTSCPECHGDGQKLREKDRYVS